MLVVFRQKIFRTTIPPDCNNEGPFGYEITMGDLKDTSYILKNNKASGEDMISKEIIKCILGCNPQTLLNLYNSALQYNPDILNWFVSFRTPIHKKAFE